jgi:hypothetical protein
MATIVTSVIIAYICTVLLLGMAGTLVRLFHGDGLGTVAWSALGLLAAIALQLYGGW